MAPKAGRPARNILPERLEDLTWLFGAWSTEFNSNNISHETFNRKNSLANFLAEMFQNIADAGSRSVRIRWAYVSLAALEAGRWSEIRERAATTSLRNAAADGSDDVLCLFIEDQGCGLGGPYEPPAPGQRPGGFQSYARGIGNSSKGAGAGGSKGIGRDSAALVSELKTVFVYSRRREDDEHIFFGRAVLEQHTYRGSNYQYEGLLLAGDGGGDAPRLPLLGDAAVAAARAVGINRDFATHGTTIVVPAVQPGIKFNDVCKEILSAQFVPILTGALTVELVGIDQDGNDDEPLVIDAQSVSELAADPRFRLGTQYSYLLETAERAIAAASDIRFDAGFPTAVLRGDFFPEDEIAALASEFSERGTFAAKASFIVRRRTDGAHGMGSLVFAVATDPRLTHGLDIRIRDGISVTRRVPSRPYVTVTVAGSPFGVADRGVDGIDQVAAMLRDGENTSHDDWATATMENRGWTPEHASLVTGCFKESVGAMVGALNRQISVNDAAAFADIFSFESPEATAGRSDAAGRQTRTDKPAPRPEPATNDDEVFAVFNLEPDAEGEWGLCVERVPEKRKRRGRPTDITAVFGFSYASTEGGKASRKHTLADFDLRSPEFEVVAENCGGIQREAKTVLVSAPRPDFRMTVRGPFDSFREIETRLEAMTRTASAAKSKTEA